MLERDEGNHIASTGNIVNQDWDAAWDSDEDDNPTNNGESQTPPQNKHSMEEERRNSEIVSSPSPADDDAVDAWGWGDDDDVVDSPIVESTEPAPSSLTSPSANPHMTPNVRQVTMSEKYWTSSMPQPVMRTVVQIFNDGAKLTQPEFVSPSETVLHSTDLTTVVNTSQ
jgi:protein transport protein DSL1/ZW10